MSLSERLWYKHPDRCWSLGSVSQLQGSRVALIDVVDNTTVVVPVDDTHPCDPTHMEDADDIARMNNMHEAPLLDLLRRRYKKDQIYTFTGEILISINPYKDIPNLYSLATDDHEKGKALDEYEDDNIPHVYTVAARAYTTMIEETNPAKKSQSLIVSGESGAGKTEACKHVMKYLASISEQYCKLRGMKDKSFDTSNIEKKVLMCNPFLEAMGNAKTLRNNNSSRFGKFLKIQYYNGRITGAFMQHYLLEKARVVMPHKGERNYHIFYQLLRGGSKSFLRQFHLGSPEDYRYLNSGGSTEVEDMDDEANFREVCGSLTVIGIDANMQEKIFRTLAAILHLGNGLFEDVVGDSGDNQSRITNNKTVRLAEELFGVSDLGERLTTQYIQIGGETVKKYQSARKAGNSRDAVAKHVYDRIFSWLVTCVNRALASDEWDEHFIGLLDIFGFEIFDVNSFEQLCINYANEKLQSLFNHHIFTMEQELYQQEGITMEEIEFQNNQKCVELIESNPYGILTMLDDVCRNLRNDMTDEKFLEEINRVHQGKNEYFVVGKKKQFGSFSVAHFAGEVQYNIEDFIDKNNDKLNDDLENAMEHSSIEFIRNMFTDEEAARAVEGASPSLGKSPTKPKRKQNTPPTIAGRFRKQLQKLHSTLLKTTPHYIRTIKPNDQKKANIFDHNRVLQQLLYSGVLETVRIRRQGFPFRETFIEFWRRVTRCGRKFAYRDLTNATDAIPVPPEPEYDMDENDTLIDKSVNDEIRQQCYEGSVAFCQALLPDDQWKAGYTKIFLKHGAIDEIHQHYRVYIADYIWQWYNRRSRWLRLRLHRAALIRRRIASRHLLRRYRALLLKRKYENAVRHVIRLQAHIRRRQAQREYKHLLEKLQLASVKIQSTYRMYASKKLTKRRLYLLKKIQATLRMFLWNLQLGRLHVYACVCQSVIRMFLAKRKRHRLKNARHFGSVTIQSWWRMCRHYFRFRQFLESRKLAAAVIIQAVWRGYRERSRAQWMKTQIIKLQAFIRMCQHFHAFQRRIQAHRKIHKWVARQHQEWVLKTWVAEIFAATCNGCMSDLVSLLNCESPEYRSLRTISIGDRASIRDGDDGFKTLMHAAALSGDVEVAQYLRSMGLGIDCCDASSSTPLHKSASIGDTHLGLMQHLVLNVETDNASLSHEERDQLEKYISNYEEMLTSGVIDNAQAIYKRSVKRHQTGGSTRNLLSAANSCSYIETSDDAIGNLFRQLRSFAQQPSGGLLFLNKINSLGETALDVAINAHRTRGRKEHDATIAFLVSAGCMSNILGSTEEALEFIGGTSSEVAMAEANAARERQLLEKRKQERLNNPHYQYLLVQEQARKKHFESPSTPTTPTSSNKSSAEETSMRKKYGESALKTALSFTNRSKFNDLLPSMRSASIEEEAQSYSAHEKKNHHKAIELDIEASDSEESDVERVDTSSPRNLDRQVMGSNTLPSSKLNGDGHRSDTSGHSSAKDDVKRESGKSRENRPMSNGLQSIRRPPPDPTATQQHGSNSGRSAYVNEVASVSSNKVLSNSESPWNGNQRSPSNQQSQPFQWAVQESKSTGLLYFYNRLTGASQWREPSDFDGTYTIDQLEKFRVAGLQWTKMMEASYQQQAEQRPPADPQRVDDGPPERWTVYVTDDGNEYYYDARTEQTQWGKPRCLEILEQDGDDDEYIEVSEDNVRRGRNGWMQIQDPRGFIYYHNSLKDVTQWERPTDF